MASYSQGGTELALSLRSQGLTGRATGSPELVRGDIASILEQKPLVNLRGDIIRTIGAVGVAQAGLLVIGLVTTVILSRWLEPTGRGEFVMALLVAATIGLLLQFGLPNSSTTFILRREFPTQTVFSTSLTLALVRVLLSGAGVAVAALLWGKFRLLGGATLLLVWGICAVDVLYVLARGLMFSVGRMRTWALLDLGISASFMALIAVTWFGGRGMDIGGRAAAYALLLYLLVRVTGLVFAGAAIRDLVHIRPGLNRTVLRALLSFGVRNMLNNIAWTLGPRMDMYVVGAMLLPADLGIYSIATGLSDKMTTLLQTVPTGLYRFQATSRNEGNRVEQLTARAMRISLALGLLMAAGVAAAASFVVPLLFGRSYGPAIAPLMILSVGAIATVGLNIFQGYFTGFQMKPEVPALFGLALALVGTAGNLLLVRRFGIAGAAGANLLSAVLVLVPFAFYFRRQTGLDWRELFVPIRADISAGFELVRMGARRMRRAKSDSAVPPSEFRPSPSNG
jgi:O-antigen/teichoic acid export membrane protein